MKNMFKDEINSAIKDLDEPLKTPSALGNFFKRGKLKVIFIYEDGSYLEVYKKFDKSYFIENKKKLYQVVPRCIIRGKRPMIMFYYNNPAPIEPKYIHSELTADLLYREPKQQTEKSDKTFIPRTYLDSEALHSAMDSNIMKMMYQGNKLSAKTLIIIGIIVFVMILIILQVTGTVDIVGAFGGSTKWL